MDEDTSASLLKTSVLYFLFALLISLVLASLGISVGFRKLYLKILLYIFEVRVLIL